MASLLDFLNSGNQPGGLLGSFARTPQGDEEKQRLAAMWRDAMLGAPGVARDPLNFAMPGMGAVGAPQTASAPAAAAPPMPPSQDVPPPGATSVSLPLPASAAPAAPQQVSRPDRIGDFFTNN